MILDSKQKEIAHCCKQIALSIRPNTFINKIKRLFITSKIPHGIYLHGSVGRGKTMLMKMFYEEVMVTKEMIHFQKFMQNVHIKLHKLQKESANRVVRDLALDISRRSQLVCMDEFEIKDITDAMIIMRLFKYLSEQGVFIFITTNTYPDNLYLDGFQRESFLPFIAKIKQDFRVMYLDEDKDYRYDALAVIKERVLYPASHKTNAQIKKIKLDLCDEKELSEVSVELFGRTINFQSGHQNILFTNFEELFERDLGYADYVAICEKFKIIVLESVHDIAEDETNIITRFINFIDNAYFYKILLFIELESEPNHLYKKGPKAKEFIRTVSRLNEMNFAEYSNANGEMDK